MSVPAPKVVPPRIFRGGDNVKAIVCDKCKKVIADEKELENVLILDVSTKKVGQFATRHLCIDCKRKFHKWVTSE